MAFTVAFRLDTRVQIEVTEVIAMIRVTKTEESSKTLVTIDGQLSGEAVGLVQACCKEAESDGKPVQLFLRDVTAIDDSGLATEAGGANNTIPGAPATGNLLANDIDPDSSLGDGKSVIAVRTGGIEGSGTSGTLGLLLQRLAGSGVRVSGSGVYTSYLVEELTAVANGGRSSPVDAENASIS